MSRRHESESDIRCTEHAITLVGTERRRRAPQMDTCEANNQTTMKRNGEGREGRARGDRKGSAERDVQPGAPEEQRDGRGNNFVITFTQKYRVGETERKRTNPKVREEPRRFAFQNG